jgi:hypothetical protein
MPSVSKRSILNPYMNIATGGLVIVVLMVALYLLLSVKDDKTGIIGLLLLMLVQLTPFLFLVTRGRFNFIGFILLNHFITYSVAKYNQLKTITKAVAFEHGAMDAIREMTFCTILIVIAYYFMRYFLGSGDKVKKQYEFLHMSRNQYLYGGLFVISQPLILDHIPGSLATMYFVLDSVVLVTLLCAKPANPVLERWVRAGILFSALVYFIKFGSLTMFGTLGGVFFIVSFVQWRPRNFLLVGLLVLVASAIQVVKMDYRVALQENPTMSPVERIETFAELITWEFFDGGHITKQEVDDQQEETEVVNDDEMDTDDGVSSGLLKGFARVGDDSLERVLEMTPAIVPFWGGETYEYLPFMFIPRILWPGKPEKLAWNKFGRLYKFLSSDDMDTSVGFNFLAEGYMNFGYNGLYSVAILFGMFVSIVEFLSYYALNGYFYFSFIIFLLPLMTYGYDFVSMLNSMLLTGSMILLLRTILLPMARRDAYGLQSLR